MKKLWIAAMILAGSAFAQEPQGVTLTQENGAVNVKLKTGGRLGGAVAGSPYSAVAVTENIQTLGDGNRIVQNHSEKLYRDGQGRERSEQTLPNGNGFTAVISDPTAKTGYMLDSRTRTARPNPPGFFTLKLPAGAGDKVLTTMYGERLTAIQAAVSGAGPVTINTEAPGGRGATKKAITDQNVVTEDLPPQNIEGVYATGKRVTRTIPAGQIGNDRPIVTVEEVWYSPDLQMNVMTKHSDPRMGENTYKLTNISRAEPDPSLFQVPPDYTMVGPKKQ